jgi:hypothetical protein
MVPHQSYYLATARRALQLISEMYSAEAIVHTHSIKFERAAAVVEW